MKTMRRNSEFHIANTIASENLNSNQIENQEHIALPHPHTSMTKHDVVKEDKYHV